MVVTSEAHDVCLASAVSLTVIIIIIIIVRLAPFQCNDKNTIC